MQNQRLLERISSIEQNPNLRLSLNPTQITTSIVQHLQKLLNTRQGSTQIAEDYGLPDFTALVTSFSSEAVRELERSIKEVIRKYEPRLSNIKVTSEVKGEDAFSLYFKVEAKISTEKGEVPVVLQTVMSSEGRINVRE